MLENREKVLAKSVQAMIQGEEDSTGWEQTVVSYHPDVQCSVLDGEAILLNLETGAYFTLNRVGTTAWELFNGERTLVEVHSAICECFDVSVDVARKDLLSLVKHLDQEGLIRSERR